jgi:imidazolonepropionase-like amidohydrolase
VIELTEAKLDQIRELTKHRADVRERLVAIRLARAAGIDKVDICFTADTKRVKMSQGDRGGLVNDLAYAFEQHLEEKDAELTKQLEDMGVKIS